MSVIVGELFAGIGGIGLGLERAGMEVKWAIENDPYACAVYRKNFPHVEVIEQDITTVDFGSLEWVDLLSGGFPCQDISYAGRGEGIEGSRSGLWKEFWRAIRVLRPRLVLVENVPGLLGRGLGCVLGDLAALGYNAEWSSFPTALTNGHYRERVFIVAYAVREGLSKRCHTKPHGGDETHIFAGQRPTSIFEVSIPAEKWADRPLLGRRVSRIPSRVDRLRCLGNAVVPQVAEWIGRRIMEVYSEKEKRRVADGG